jgi:hypothetical protein
MLVLEKGESEIQGFYTGVTEGVGDGWERSADAEKPAPGWVERAFEERQGVVAAKNYAGDHLISHTLSRAVPSAQRGLTSVFGMGTGGTLAVWSPANLSDAWRVVSPAADGSGQFFLRTAVGRLASQLS